MKHVLLTFVDGHTETYETMEKMEVNGPILIIKKWGDDYIAFNLAHILKWEVVASKVAVPSKVIVPGGMG